MESTYWQLRRWFNFDLLDERTAFLFFLPASIIIIFFVYRWGLKKLKQFKYLNKDDFKFFKKIVWYKVFFLLFFFLIWLPSPFKSIVYAPFGIVSSILPLLVLIRVLQRKYNTLREIDLLKINTQAELNEKVAKLLNSENFLTALRSTLPKGNKDEEYGLDYIPYMLKNVDERRQRFSVKARNFLTTSITIGLLFVGIVIWLSYIILDEDSIGTGKVVRQLDEQITLLNNNISFFSTDLYLQTKEFNEIKKELSEIRTISKSIDDSISAQINECFNNFNHSHNMDSLYSQINSIIIPINKTEYVGFIIARSRLENHIQNFRNEQQVALKSIPRLIPKIESTIKSAKEELSKTTNRTPEIIKRLILSIVIISFFLAILRFLTNQYKRSFDQLILAEDEDIYIRKTYIALKTAGDNDESKRIILSKLLTKLEKTSSVDKVDENKGNLTVIKDLIETLAKKL